MMSASRPDTKEDEIDDVINTLSGERLVTCFIC